MTWRLALSLAQLRDQVNDRWPNRDKSSDGSVGDAAHATRSSDHNPWVKDGALGVVTAIDITHDPRSGCDSYALADVIRASRDPRVKYIISNRRICSSDVDPWQWREYRGANPHDHHVHISVHSDKKRYDAVDPWNLSAAAMPAPKLLAPVVPQTLRIKDRGKAVEEMQRALAIKGLTLAIDGMFGPATLEAVKRFQSARGLVPDGVCGPQTWAALR